MIKNADKSEKNPEVEKRMVEMDTFLLAYLTAKVRAYVHSCAFVTRTLTVILELFRINRVCVSLEMENNNAKFKAEAEARILQMMEEEERLHDEMKEKRRQFLLAEKKRVLNELLDLQVWTLCF